jgi:hypothetical protein
VEVKAKELLETRPRAPSQAKSVDDSFGIELCAFDAGVGVVGGKEGCGLVRSESLEAIGFDGGHVDDGDVLGGVHGADLGVIGGVSGFHVALDTGYAAGVGCPDIADGESEENGRGVLPSAMNRQVASDGGRWRQARIGGAGRWSM